MKPKLTSVLVCGIVISVALGVFGWMRGAPRRESLTALTRLDDALHSGQRDQLLGLLAIPEAVRARTPAEQSESLGKALNDEISNEGLTVLRKHGEYGPLKKLFPAEAETWAKQAGVNPEECVAFKLERPGVRAEVVLVPALKTAGDHSSPVFRIVRLNNVKQLAYPDR